MFKLQKFFWCSFITEYISMVFIEMAIWLTTIFCWNSKDLNKDINIYMILIKKMWGQFLLRVFPGEEGWLCNCFTALKHAEKWSPMLISFPLGRVPNKFHIWVNYGQSRPHVNVTYIDFKLRLVFLPLHWLKLYFLFPLMIHAKISFLCITVLGRWYYV